MIRQPSTISQLYDWHRRAIAGENPPRYMNEPQCGFYKMRKVKNGPWVPVRLYIEREVDLQTGELASDEIVRAEVNGLDAGDPVTIWTYLTPISRAEFDHLADYRLRNSRMLDTNRKVDLSDAPTPPQGVY